MQGANNYRIFLSPPYQGGEELHYLTKALESNWLAPGGDFVHQFESKLTKITNRKHCVALNSGTAAIHLALKVLGIGAGDHVICQTFSFVATANPIAYLGAIPVFVDSEITSWNMDPNLLEEAILDLRKSNIHPKAIIYTHIYGNPAQADALIDISEKYEIPIIEDAAEALGANIQGKAVGQFGKISILSFNGNKVITTSGGGAFLSNDHSLSERALLLSNQARDSKQPYAHVEVGYNYRMSNVSASLGMAQISHLDEWVNRKRSIFAKYQKVNSQGFHLDWVKDREGLYSNRWLSVFLIESEEKRDNIQSALRKIGIESRRFWKPLHLLNIFGGQKSYINGVANTLFAEGICLPSGVGLKIEEQEEIIHVIREII